MTGTPTTAPTNPVASVLVTTTEAKQKEVEGEEVAFEEGSHFWSREMNGVTSS